MRIILAFLILFGVCCGPLSAQAEYVSPIGYSDPVGLNFPDIGNQGPDSEPVKLRISSGICGDAMDNGNINILDINYLIAYLYTGGPEPYHIRLADVNSDCSIDILDVVYLVEYLYAGGPDPVCPEEWPCP